MLTRGSSDPDASISVVRRIEWNDGESRDLEDRVVREEPLEIRIGGVPVAVVMRTPGHDEELVRGFVTTERVVDDPAWVASVRHCTTVETPEAENNVVQVILRPGVAVDLAGLRRNLYASSSCGLCGKASIDRVLAVAPPLHDDVRIPAEILCAIPDRMRSRQTVFSQTGGLHAAGLFDAEGSALVVREDVGRHNAVDKVVGWTLKEDRVLAGHVLAVSGRVSFEIVQKALAARIPVVAAVSAPSSLAVDLAHRGELTLVAFVRGRRLCVYAGTERVT